MSESLFDRRIREKIEAGKASIDGFLRAPDLEEKINAAFAATLNGPSGRMVMDYLRSITVNTVLPPSASDGELRMQEGMRRLFGIIDARRGAKKETP